MSGVFHDLVEYGMLKPARFQEAKGTPPEATNWKETIRKVRMGDVQ